MISNKSIGKYELRVDVVVSSMVFYIDIFHLKDK